LRGDDLRHEEHDVDPHFGDGMSQCRPVAVLDGRHGMVEAAKPALLFTMSPNT
jgi:hypothetical protein